MARGRVYNRTYTEEDYAQVNPINIAIVKDYLEEYTQRKKKPSTIKQYANDLRIILIYIYRHLDNRSLLELNKKDFRSLSIWFSDTLKLSNARTNGLMSAIRSLLTYIEDDDCYEYNNNIAKKVHGLPKEAVRTDEDNFFLTYNQIIKLKDELLKRNKLYHAVLLMVFFDSGGRRREVFEINKQNLLNENNNKTNIVIGKRGKPFPLVYLNDTKELIRKYMLERGNDDINCLWVIGKGENKRSASYENLYDHVVYMSKIFSEIEGKQIEFFPHSLRHSRIECLLMGEDPRIIDPKTGLPKKFTLEEVQKFVHHSDPKTTQDYSKDHTEEDIDKMFGF